MLRMFAFGLMLVVTPLVARGADIATLPLGDPSRAYVLATGEAGQILSCVPADGTRLGAAPVTLEALAADLAAADVVIIGEHHTNMEGHRTQWKILDAIAATGKPFALGMEFFEIQDDEALARYVSGESDLVKMLDETGWYAGGGYNFEFYRPAVETCARHKAPIYGLNVPREWVRMVSRQGKEALSAEQREAVGELGPVSERHKYMINQMMSGMGASMPQMFEGMYRGQTTWDAAMATSILKLHRKHRQEGTARTIVAIVGVGHMAHGLGIPERLKAADPSLTIRTLAPAQGTKPDDDMRLHPGFERKETATFSLGLADYVYILPDDGNALEFPDVAVRMEHAKEAGAPLRIGRVLPGSVGERAGLRPGDVVVSIGGESPTTPSMAGITLSTLRWNERVVWKVRREGAQGAVDVPMLVVPATDEEGDWLKSRPASGLLDSFDPMSDRSYKDNKDFRPSAAHARLVTFRNDVVRIDVMRDGVLLETWNLDSQGRPVLGLLAQPARDGAVRIEITRDETGKATSVRRLDASGAVIQPARQAEKH